MKTISHLVAVSNDLVIGVNNVGSNSIIFEKFSGFLIADLKMTFPPIECPIPIILFSLFNVSRNFSLKIFQFFKFIGKSKGETFYDKKNCFKF